MHLRCFIFVISACFTLKMATSMHVPKAGKRSDPRSSMIFVDLPETDGQKNNNKMSIATNKQTIKQNKNQEGREKGNIISIIVIIIIIIIIILMTCLM